MSSHEYTIISSEANVYEVGKDNVVQIELTEHGNKKTAIYKLTDANGNFIMYAGLLVPNEVEEINMIVGWSVERKQEQTKRICYKWLQVYVPLKTNNHIQN